MKKIAVLTFIIAIFGCHKNDPVYDDGIPKNGTITLDGSLHYEPPQGDGLGWVLSNNQGKHYAVKTPSEAFRVENLQVHASLKETRDSVCGWGCYPQYEIVFISKK